MSGQPAAARDRDRLAVPLSGWMRPKQTTSVAGRSPRTAGRRRRRRGAPSRRSRSPGTRSASEIETNALPTAGRPGRMRGRREAVDRRHQRRLGEARERQRQPVEVVVDQVELRRPRRARARRAAPPRCARRSSRPPRTAARHTPSSVASVTESSVANSVTSTPRADEAVGEQAGDELPRAVVARRRPPGDRPEQRDLHGAAASPAARGVEREQRLEVRERRLGALVVVDVGRAQAVVAAAGGEVVDRRASRLRPRNHSKARSARRAWRSAPVATNASTSASTSAAASSGCSSPAPGRGSPRRRPRCPTSST